MRSSAFYRKRGGGHDLDGDGQGVLKSWSRKSVWRGQAGVALVVTLVLLGLYAAAREVRGLPLAAGEPAKLAALPGTPAPKLRLVKRLKLDHWATGTAWSPDGRRLVTSENYDATLKIWNTQTWTVEHVIQKQTVGSERNLFTPDSRYLITSAIDIGRSKAGISIIEVVSGQVVRQIDGPNDPERTWGLANKPPSHLLTLSRDGRYLFVYFLSKQVLDERLHVFDVENGQEIAQFRPQWGVHTLVAGPQSDQVVTSDVHGFVQLWNWRTGQLLESFQASTSSLWSIAMDRQGRRLATEIFSTGKMMDPNTQRLADVGEADALRVWDLPSGRLIASSPALPTNAEMAFSPSGGFLISILPEHEGYAPLDDGRDLKQRKPSQGFGVYRAADLRFMGAVAIFKAYAWSAEFTRDGQYLALSGDNEVLIYTYNEAGGS